MRFWDSSALVPLLTPQSHTRHAVAWLQADPAIAAWALTPAEVTSALERLRREGLVSLAAVADAEARMERFLRSAFIVEDIAEVQPTAQRLVRAHPLRAADALQLGAALVWVCHRFMRRLFLTFDQRLAEAASGEGFTIL